MNFSRRATLLVAVCVGAAVLLIAADHLWLGWLGQALVSTQQPAHADMIVVLGGDLSGNRILKASQLAHEGMAPTVLVSGAGEMYGRLEADIAVDFAVAHGYDEPMFVRFRKPASSTKEEARLVIAEMRRRQVRSYIVVTSAFHTARAGRIFRQLAPDLKVWVVAAPDRLNWTEWWTDREGRKTFFMEWTKTLTGALGI